MPQPHINDLSTIKQVIFKRPRGLQQTTHTIMNIASVNKISKQKRDSHSSSNSSKIICRHAIKSQNLLETTKYKKKQKRSNKCLLRGAVSDRWAVDGTRIKCLSMRRRSRSNKVIGEHSMSIYSSTQSTQQTDTIWLNEDKRNWNNK